VWYLCFVFYFIVYYSNHTIRVRSLWWIVTPNIYRDQPINLLSAYNERTHCPQILGDKKWGVNLGLWAKTSPLSEMMRSCKWFPRVSKMPTLTYNRAYSVIIKNTFRSCYMYDIIVKQTHCPQILGDRIPPFFVKKNSPFFSFFLVFLWLTCAISSEKSHYFIFSYHERNLTIYYPAPATINSILILIVAGAG
jgi:hypothetical protein